MKIVPFIHEEKLAIGLIFVIMLAAVTMFSLKPDELPAASRSDPSR